MNNQNYVDYFYPITHNVIIGGHNNAKYHRLGCRTNNPWGIVFHNFTNQMGYTILVPLIPSYWFISQHKIPDILDIFFQYIE